jgi:hypothetical protein
MKRISQMEHSRAGRPEIIGLVQNKFLIIGRKNLRSAEFQPITDILDGKYKLHCAVAARTVELFKCP